MTTGLSFAPQVADSSVKMLDGHRWVVCALIHRPVLDDAAQRRARKLLSSDERRGADRIQSPMRRTEHILGRLLARRLLGAALDMDPIRVPLETAAGTKPRLRGSFPVSDFSVSHSGGRVLVGMTAHGHIGVDVETGRSYSERLARRSLDPKEFEQVAVKEGDDRTMAFLERWTAKEARLKAMGIGISGRDVVDELHCESIALGSGVAAAVALRPRPGRSLPEGRIIVSADEEWALDR